MGALPFLQIKPVRAGREIIAHVNRAYDPERQAALKLCCDGSRNAMINEEARQQVGISAATARLNVK